MDKTIRIMPCLDMQGGRVVKGVHFTNLRDAGDPVLHARFYEDEGADELAMLDIAATVEARKTRVEWVRRVAAAIRIPLTVGGGIGSLEDIRTVLAAGATRVSINTAAVRNPDLVRAAAGEFGAEHVIVAIDGRRNAGVASGFEVVVAGGTQPRARMPWCGRGSVRSWAPGCCCPPAWTGMGRWSGTTWRSPAPLRMR